MGVAPVDFGDGKPVPIDQSNAKQALERRKELDLTTAQIKYAKSFLSEDELNYIFQSENESKDRGENAISDKEKAEAHGGQGGNVALTTGINAGLLAAAIVAICVDGFTALAISITESAGGLVSIGMAKLFDNGYADRTACRDNGDATNEIIDGYTSDLEGSMDTMNDDADEYADALDNYTASKNDNVNRQAETQIMIQDAEAMGDAKKVAELKEQLKGLGEADFSKEEEEMSGIKDRLEEYSSISSEASGASSAATTVADFLKEGTVLGIFAGINGLMCTAIGVVCGAAAAGLFPKSIFDIPPASAAKILFGVAAGFFATSAGMFTSKAKNEFECASKGKDMQNHVDTLNDMIGEQTDYVDQSDANYTAADTEAAGNQADAAKKAGDATQKHAQNYKKEDDDKDKSGAGTGSGGGSGGGGNA